jgi:hypothetical protein
MRALGSWRALTMALVSACLVFVPVSSHLYRTVEIVEKSMLYARTEVVQQECCNNFYAEGMNHSKRFNKYFVVFDENYLFNDVADLSCNTMLSHMGNDPCYWQGSQRRMIKQKSAAAIAALAAKDAACTDTTPNCKKAVAKGWCKTHAAVMSKKCCASCNSPVAADDFKSKNDFMLKSSHYICKCVTSKQDAWLSKTQSQVAKAKALQLHQHDIAKLRTKGKSFFFVYCFGSVSLTSLLQHHSFSMSPLWKTQMKTAPWHVAMTSRTNLVRLYSK